MSDFLAKYWQKVSPEPNSGCWLWVGSINQYGYGRISLGAGHKRVAHRISYEMDRGGAVPDGLQLDHLCRVRCCVNPDHLEAVTQQVNLQRGRGFTKRLTKVDRGFCAHGHAMVPENCFYREGNGVECRVCRRQANSAYRGRIRAGLIANQGAA